MSCDTIYTDDVKWEDDEKPVPVNDVAYNNAKQLLESRNIRWPGLADMIVYPTVGGDVHIDARYGHKAVLLVECQSSGIIEVYGSSDGIRVPHRTFAEISIETTSYIGTALVWLGIGREKELCDG